MSDEKLKTQPDGRKPSLLQNQTERQRPSPELREGKMKSKKAKDPKTDNRLPARAIDCMHLETEKKRH